MSNIKDCGPAFPQDYEHTKAAILTHKAGGISAEQLLHCARQLRGMTLRDYFAAKAMQAWFSDPKADFADPKTHERAAKFGYMIADQMLEVRQE